MCTKLQKIIDDTFDFSYTPNKLSIQIGNDPHDLRQIEMLELDEPSGWINVDLEEKGRPVKTFYVQVRSLGSQLYAGKVSLHYFATVY